MDVDQENAEQQAMVQLIRLRARAQGIALGLIIGLGVFVATNWLVIKGGENVGQHLRLLGQYFIGYRVTFLGSIIGAIYGFILGFLLGYSIARFYNFFASFRSRPTAKN